MGESRNLSAMLNRHFAVLGSAAAAVAGVGVFQQADANIVYVANANINIPSTTSGVYLNVVTGVFGTASGTPGWDVNPWSSGGLGLFNPSAPSGGVYVGNSAGGISARNLSPGDPIGPAQLYGSNSSTPNSANPAFNLNSAANLVGFRFQNEANGNAIHYGWMRISLSTSEGAQPRSIVEYAYENVAGTAIAAGDTGVPEPASLGLLALGAMGIARRRK